MSKGPSIQISFKTSNGLYRMETGQLITENDSSQKYIVRGSYSYIDPDGKEVVVYYIADENGYATEKPLPTPPAGSVVAAGVPGPVVASLLG
ncbi:larval cuticle protein LCP-17-like isoform X2 [Leguminivora glycinivorella]|uniref:larval cuticle protein LCP-17-like isoform X2 n=1 Tax=Leguminivora glycinivorella TaxID=1035111 RepID=UPI00200DD8F0|nr:larval cuticle protein LCP-17-like isoform X2 [Leguminivora glycinivorella]